jgi:hypothetical protein
MPTYKGIEAAILTAADETFGRLLIDLCDSLGAWRKYVHVIDIGLGIETRHKLARRKIEVIDIPESFFANARLDRKYFRAMYLRPSLREFISADIIMWIDSDCWVQRRSAIPAYFEATLAFPEKFSLCTMLDIEYGRCIDDYWSYQQSRHKQYVAMFGQQEADRLFGNAVFSTGVFAARRASTVWSSWRAVVSKSYDSGAASADLDLGHMAEQNALNFVLHRDRQYHVLNSEMNWHCHCADMFRKSGYVRIRPSGRIPAIVHLSNMKNDRVAERYRERRLFYEKPYKSTGFRLRFWRASRASVNAAAVARPSPLFDRDWYLASNPDVSEAQVDPWQHYVEFGVAEGRDPNPLFDTDWYLNRYAEELPVYANPLLHYWDRGATSGFDPNPFFDSDWYLERNPDVGAQELNPLFHYWRIGAAEGRDPCAQFNTARYLRTSPDLPPGRLTPLGDYLLYGRQEGRSISPPRRATRSSSRLQSARLPPRIAVYTAIAGDYDCLKIPTEIDERCDYYCFTDRDISWQDIWARREFNWWHEDPVRVSRYVKHHPHRFFPDYEWSIWVDGNIQLNCLPQALLPPSPDSWDLAVWKHPYRNCLYAEAEECVRLEKDDAATIWAQVARYRAQGFPEHAGLAENNVMARRHNAPAMIELAHAWWREISGGSRRDQLSFPFVAAKLGLRVADLGPHGTNARSDPRLRFFAHNLPRPHE